MVGLTVLSDNVVGVVGLDMVGDKVISLALLGLLAMVGLTVVGLWH